MARIPLPEPNKADIYTFGFNKHLNRESDLVSSSTVYDALGEALNSGQVLSGGNLNLKTLSIGGLTKMVAPGDDIQAAIDDIARQGGGKVQFIAATYLLHDNLILKDNVSLVGAGADITILDFQGKSYRVQCGSTGLAVSNTNVVDMTITDSSDSTGGLWVINNSASNFQNLNISDCTGTAGIYLSDINACNFNNIISLGNTGNGFYFTGIDGVETQENIVVSCHSISNGGYGFYISDCQFLNFIACRAHSNTTTAVSHGWVLADGSNRILLTACSATNNSGDGLHVLNDNTQIRANCIGFFSSANVGEDYLVERPAAVVVLTNPRAGGVTAHQIDSQRIIEVMDNDNVTSNRRGSVVVRRGPSLSVGSEPGVTTTTTNGDNRVFGVVAEAALSGQPTQILTEGHTSELLVSNGTASITVGDFLSTYSHAYYAKLARAGETVFALSMETVSGSTAAIDALLIKPFTLNYDKAGDELITQDSLDDNLNTATRTLILTAAGGSPTTTIGCGGPTKVEAGTNDIDYWALEFDTTSEERAFWNVQMPDNYNGGTVTARFIWTNASGTAAQTVRWGIKGLSRANDEAIDTAFGTEVTVDDTFLAQGDVHISPVTSALTIGGSPAGGEYVIFNVGRKVAGDNLAGDARLLAVQIEYTINDYSD